MTTMTNNCNGHSGVDEDKDGGVKTISMRIMRTVILTVMVMTMMNF